jgi:hypothetical protein
LVSAGRAAEISAVLGTIVSIEPFGHHGSSGRGEAFIVLLAFLVSFLFIRTSARLTRSVSWWPGGVQSGGVHLHHLVWGICLMLFSGFLAFAAPMEPPWWHIDAALFGVGAGFTLDEFALWVRLEDVYWSAEGRSSVDAVVVAFAFAALVVLGTEPFGLDDPGSVWATVAILCVLLGLIVVSAAKGHVFLAVTGIFIPVLALVGAVQLAHPQSIWARRLYHERKLDRARRRYAPTSRLTRFGNLLSSLLAGAPNDQRKTMKLPAGLGQDHELNVGESEQ